MASPYRVLAYTLLPFLRWRIQRVHGLENLPRGGFIVAANHQSWIDSALVAAALYRNIEKSIKMVAQSSKYQWLGGIPINEYDKRQVIDIALGYLESGHPIVIFPEGNSNRNPELRSGKTGAARLALRSGLPVVPAGIQGTRGVKAWQAALWFFRFWKPCRVTFGQPLSFPKTTLTGQDDALLDQTTQAIMQRISDISTKPYGEREPQPNRLPNQSFLSWFLWRVLMPLFSFRVKVTGTEHLPTHGAYIVAANHVSYFDAPAVSIAIYRARKIFLQYPTNPVVAAAFRKLIGKSGLEALGMLPIDPTSRATVLNSMIDFLRGGGVVGIFPEGSRNRPAKNPRWQTEHLKAKTGAVRLHLATGLPVIPVGVHAPMAASVGMTLLQVLAFWKTIRIDFGAPVSFSSHPSVDRVTKPELESLTRELMEAISPLSGLRYPY